MPIVAGAVAAVQQIALRADGKVMPLTYMILG